MFSTHCKREIITLPTFNLLSVIFYAPASIDRGHIVLPCLSVCPSVCLLKTKHVNLTFSYNFHSIQITMLILGMKHISSIRISRYQGQGHLPRSRWNIKVTFLKKLDVLGALVLLFVRKLSIYYVA